MYRIEHLIDAMRLARIDSDIDSDLTDYATPQDRLNPPARCLCARCLDGSNARIREQSRRGDRPYTPAVRTDVRETMRRWCAENGQPMPAWLEQSAPHAGGTELPSLLRRQAM